MAFVPGSKIGPYEVVALLGAGGMGEVYRAHDPKLKRDVAVKVLPDAFAGDPERLARFTREAQVLASLNHPNIAQIYGVEDRALVMELVEGEAPRGPMAFEAGWKLASQIAGALDYAHDRGIVHRDLKPSNIKVTPEGVVKLLDFGLAKAFRAEAAASANAENSPTLTLGATQVGVILGTAAYMSPEQAKGKSVDKRADIWSFGVVLYELLTGRSLFKGEDVTETLASVVKEKPDLSKVPSEARRLLQSCLEKDPNKRLRDIGDVSRLLDEPEAPAADAARPSRIPWAVAAAVAVVALGLGYLAYRHATEEAPRLVTLSMEPPPKAGFSNNDVPAISPDGRHVAFTVIGQTGLWVRDVDSPTSRQVSTTERVILPFWSPDSRSIAFFGESKLKRIELAGGPEQTLADAGLAQGGAWGRDGVIVYGPALGGLFRIPAAGGTPAALTTLEPGTVLHRTPEFLPDGHHFLYSAVGPDPAKFGVYVADLDSNTRRRILTDVTNAVYAAPGYLLFLRDRALMAQPFDADKAQTTGEAVPVAESASRFATGGMFSASQNGVLVYNASQVSGNAQLTWFDRSGRTAGTVGPPGAPQLAWISPDETAVADSRSDASGNLAIWMHDLKHTTDSKLTFGTVTSGFPVWSPDSSHIAFVTFRGSNVSIVQKATKGPGQDEILDDDARVKRPQDWTRDGRYLIEQTPADSKSGSDIWVLPLMPDSKSGTRKAVPYLHESYNESYARVAPNGQWLAYVSDETKRNEIYVMTFPTPGRKWQVSVNGGNLPIWSRDGKELFFISPDQKMMAVDVKTGADFEFGTPKALFDVHMGGPEPWFDVSKDGRFLMPVPTEQSGGAPLTVVLNWTAKLRR